jgi:NAD(P)-dependent dehydrogenase (short-subunit alcohol dehydrogenase family)
VRAQGYSLTTAYGQSKFANTVLTFELADRLRSQGVVRARCAARNRVRACVRACVPWQRA